jgi:diguanylate cyclase (GGDEF)-like protein
MTRTVGRTRAERRERAAWLTLGVALALWLAGDVLWALGTGARAAFPGWAGLPWLAGYPAAWLGLAALLRARVRGARGATLWLDGLIAARAAATLPAGRRRAAPEAGAHVALPAAFTVIALAIVLFDRQFGGVGDAAVDLALAVPLLLVVRLALGVREHARLLARSRREALTDALTGLGNRRALMRALREALEDGRDGADWRLALFDLDGFKTYNDMFGHVAGDVLLEHLGTRLDAAVRGVGRAFRMGGDEFCVLVPADRSSAALVRAGHALREEGDGFRIDASAGVVELPGDAADAEAALQLADRRMYARKDGRPASAARQSGDVLLAAIGQREPELLAHTRAVARLARELATALGLDAEERDAIARAAELHDVGKVAIPDAILAKRGPLDPEEAAFMRRHTVIGEAIIAGAPALRPVAALVRASHERWDGGGYPDGLAGEAIPLGARIVSVCDAFSAMLQQRPYGEPLAELDALDELRASAGAQFDPAVVAAFCVLRASAPAERRFERRLAA